MSMSMFKNITKFVLICLLAASVSGCATVFGGPVSSYQKLPPKAGDPPKQIRVGALVADVLLFWPGILIDFATGAIYKPLPAGYQAPTAPQQPQEQPIQMGGSTGGGR